jgi:hypothetical protein
MFLHAKVLGLRLVVCANGSSEITEVFQGCYVMRDRPTLRAGLQLCPVSTPAFSLLSEGNWELILLGVQRWGMEPDHSLLYIGEFKEKWSR